MGDVAKGKRSAGRHSGTGDSETEGVGTPGYRDGDLTGTDHPVNQPEFRYNSVAE